ncbi:Gfo/Idh/MocA family oxidoreductase [Isoptericola halotolerans]|uniref:Gfo/Idh/MocA family protein n=1 Tax=Isoptericola halotolerans TaxID=300560 RepID=UPI00389040FA
MTAAGYFAPVTGAAPVRIVLVGVGVMGRRWLEVVESHPDAELVGVVDLDADAAASAAASAHGEVASGADLGEVALRTAADAVVNVTSVAAHHPVTTQALEAGLAVLGEKPLAADLAHAADLAVQARRHGRLFMVSQSRRYHRGLHTLRAATAGLGPVADATAMMFRAPRFDGFRVEMDSPLIVDMAIHAFDGARFVLYQDPVAVYAEEHNPQWSWYRGAASATAIFTMSGGAWFTLTGSWCTPGIPTSWNGQWRVNARDGAAVWDGEGTVRTGRDEEPGDGVAIGTTPEREDIAGALDAFLVALRSGTTPDGDVGENIASLAMVTGAVESARTGQRVDLVRMLDEARRSAAGA